MMKAKKEFDQLHFAWWGADEPFKGHAYHIHGPSFAFLLYAGVFVFHMYLMFLRANPGL